MTPAERQARAVELVRRARAAGPEDAASLRWEVAILYTSLAVATARRWTRGVQELRDVAQTGMIGLYDAACRYDPDRGVQFATMARWWVRARISRWHGPYQHLPHPMRELVRNLGRAEGAGYGSTPEQLAEVLHRTPETIHRVLAAIEPMLHLNAPAGDGEAFTLQDAIAAEEDDTAHDPADVQRLQVLIADLPVRERKIVCGYYGIGREPATLDAVGREVCVGRERARQIREEALTKLRKKMGVQA